MISIDRLVRLLLLLLLLLPSHTFDDSCPDIEQDRNEQTQGNKHHRFKEVINIIAVLVDTTIAQGTLKIIVGSKITVAVLFSITTVSCPLRR